MLSPWSWAAAGDVCPSSSVGRDTVGCVCDPIGLGLCPPRGWVCIPIGLGLCPYRGHSISLFLCQCPPAGTAPVSPVAMSCSSALHRWSRGSAPLTGLAGTRHCAHLSLGTDPSCRHAAIQAPMALRNRLQSSAVPVAAGSSARHSARSRPSCPLCPVMAATYSTTRCGCTSPVQMDRGLRDHHLSLAVATSAPGASATCTLGVAGSEGAVQRELVRAAALGRG